MKHGGFRPGAGRPKGSKNKNSVQQPEQAATYSGVDKPLDYLLRVMGDPLADFERRDAAARAALPYLHPRLAPKGTGVKAEAEAAAQTAGQGSEWEADLQFTDLQFIAPPSRN